MPEPKPPHRFQLFGKHPGPKGGETELRARVAFFRERKSVKRTRMSVLSVKLRDTLGLGKVGDPGGPSK